jgi:DNA ligase-4
MGVIVIFYFSEENIQPSNDKHAEDVEVEPSHAKNVRKRGRPASSSSRTVRAAPKPVRRTKARRGNKHAKIDDIESEESGPGETGQDDLKSNTDDISKMEEDSSHKDHRPPRAAPRPVRRTNARRGNRRAKVDYHESEESEPGEGQEDQNMDTKEDNLDKDLGPPPGAQFIALDEEKPKVVKLTAAEETTSSPKYESKGTSERTNAVEGTSMRGEKIEQMVDPLHAMLLDMLPSLRNIQGEHASSAPPAKVEIDPPQVGSSASNYRAPMPEMGSSASNFAAPTPPTPQTASSSQGTSIPAPAPDGAAPKKKKVSYKDMAGELLKDW